MVASGNLPAKGRLHRWLTTSRAESPTQAAVQQAYFSWLRFRRNTLGLFGLGIVCMLILVAVFAPFIATHDPIAQDLGDVLHPPDGMHWFGTDELGRDIFSRIVYGSRITLYIVMLASVIVMPIGLAVGTTAGYFGGWVDEVLMRVTDLFLSFPGLILALAFVSALGPGLENAIMAIALTAWPNMARLARAETLTIRKSDYILAVRIQGASAIRILARHITPMCIPSVIIRVALNMAGVILTAAGLGFLGLGAQPPIPEWGAMISTGRKYMLDSWWLVTAPGVAIIIVSLAFNLLGDALRDTLDPRGE